MAGLQPDIPYMLLDKSSRPDDQSAVSLIQSQCPYKPDIPGPMNRWRLGFIEIARNIGTSEQAPEADW
jgi:hypothetical protein